MSSQSQVSEGGACEGASLMYFSAASSGLGCLEGYVTHLGVADSYVKTDLVRISWEEVEGKVL